MQNIPYLSLTIIIPVLGALAVMVTPKDSKVMIRVISSAFSFLMLVVSAIIFFGYDRSMGGYQLVEQYSWLKQLGVTLYMGVDGISAPMVLLTGIIIFTGSLASWSIEDRPKEYFVLLLLLVAGVFGTFVAIDLFFLFFFYELAVLPMYLLIGVWGAGPKEYAAMKLTIHLMLGSALIWVAFVAIYFTAGLGTFDLLQIQSVKFSAVFQSIMFLSLFLGFGTLAGFWPLHSWSPVGHACAPTAVSMLHAGVLMKLGAYGIIRIAMTLFPDGAAYWLPILAFFTIINVVYGAFSAMGQTDLKYVIAYSSVSHMGLVLLGICSKNALALDGAVLQMVSHGIMTGLFFSLVGMVYDRTHTREIAKFGGLATNMPFIASSFAIAGLASLGLPALSGFVAEFFVLTGALKAYPVLGIIAISGIVVTAAYVLRVLKRIFFGEANTPEFTKLTDATFREKLAPVILIGFIIAIGVYPSWIMDTINVGVQELLTLMGA